MRRELLSGPNGDDSGLLLLTAKGYSYDKKSRTTVSLLLWCVLIGFGVVFSPWFVSLGVLRVYVCVMHTSVYVVVVLLRCLRVPDLYMSYY